MKDVTPDVTPDATPDATPNTTADETLDVQKEKVPKESASKAKSKKIKVQLAYDKQKGDLFVSVNGENFQIQRGKEVEVPDYVAEVIKNSVRQDELTEMKIDELVNGSVDAALN